MSDNHPQDPLVTLLEEDEVFRQGSLSVLSAKLQYRRSDGQMSEPQPRRCVERGDAVGVLVFDPVDESVVLVRQFRYPVYSRLDEGARRGAGAREAWLLEIAAGMQEHGQSAEETARREVSEEIGYDISGPLERIATVYTTPGFVSERITLYLAELPPNSERGAGGGLVEEGEDTALVRLPAAEAWVMVERGEICDAKTVIALQHLRLKLLRG
ncbi:MAG TPA: NUDIX hydrolase [Roseiflexaceae bacterium]|nr:NUDIX hydrolase [Roseiflexaceae bacterium]